MTLRPSPDSAPGLGLALSMSGDSDTCQDRPPCMETRNCSGRENEYQDKMRQLQLEGLKNNRTLLLIKMNT